MSTIKIEQLSFGFDKQGTYLFENADLSIDTHWKLGLIGRNGRGKTTLLQLLLGTYPHRGTIDSPLELVYFPSKVRKTDRLTYEVLSDVEIFELWQLEREMNLIRLNPELLWQPFSTLSGGEQTKALLALLFTQENRYPLLDEPTNHLDVKARKHVASYLQKKTGFIVVSHDRQFVDDVVDHILAIERSQLVLYQGNFTIYEEQKKLRDATEQAQNAKLKKEVSRLKQTAAEKAEWSRSREKDKYGRPSEKGSGAINDTGFIGARAARVMKRSKQIEGRMQDQVRAKEQLLKDIEEVDQLTMNYRPTHHQQLLKLEDVQLSYQTPLFSPLSLEVNKGEIIAIRGANGSGKSSLFAFLLEQFEGISQGTRLQPKILTVSYVRQNYEDNRGDLRGFAEKNHLDYSAFLNNLRKLGMERNVFENRIEEMSMGQRKKVELAKSLSQEAELYLWDEPLNYLDVFNQEQLEELLLRIKPAMLIIEHDRRFLDRVADQQIELAD
ncbi:Lsa family ABC-F type ribosomal protection protein [Enterococcus florum]|uniref:Lsa family ABC-F type ribosomal protection protein n=1 Tax=Enterococcus florum TaxID=2480627 RepID=A0A4V0WPZ6_9ENTE|nr:ABC-F type ribosomal protection protein [Enterococcus florum]GCF95589.1 Lsa family ABC-F type ribosomal protection protein [Enterococcus florum]